MSWKERNKMSLRVEFVLLATKENSNISAICKQFGISRKTGYKWLKRYQEGGLSFLTDQPRTRLAQPTKTNDIITNKIINLRSSHPSWGARKLKRRLEDLGEISIPSTTTVGNILKRHNKISELSSTQSKAFIRFEHPEPNDLWQMDFKGWFNTDKSRCYPLTVLDDHSRYSITLKECLNERTEGVKSALITAFRTYGLPKRMTMDNGAPWAGSNNKQITKLKAWLIRIGIKVSHSRPYHPQTQGKDERFSSDFESRIVKSQ